MATKLAKLISIRSRILGDLEHHISEIEKFNDQTNGTAINFRSIAFEKTYKEFVNVLEELDRVQAYHELENLEDVIRKNRSVQDKYLTSKLMIAELVPNTNLNSTFYDVGPQEFEEKGRTVNTQYRTGLKLPELRLLPFAGKFEEWPSFKDMFLSVMKKYQGDDAEKLSHLKSYLKGEAHDVVKHLAIQNANFEVALELLTRAYENTNAIVDSHLKNLFGIPTISEDSASSIRHAITTTNGCLAGIKKLDVLTETWDTIIVYLLKEKLGPDMRVKWEEQRRGSFELSDLKTFITFLETRKKIADSLPPKKSRTSTPESHAKPKARALLTQKPASLKEMSPAERNDTPNTSARRSETCTVCKEMHRIFNCPKLTENSQNAYRIITELRLCENCLYAHAAKDCKSLYVCKQCKQRHHTLLHDAITHPSNYAAVHYISHGIRTLLATALIPIPSPAGKIHLRALIDQGSTTNLITERGAQLLRCHRKRVNVPLLGVGDHKAGTIKHKVQFVIGSIYEETFRMPVDVLVTPYITTVPPMSIDILSQYKHLKGLEFAEPPDNTNVQIDLLIGALTLADLLEPGMIKGRYHEPIAQKSKIGWLISGAVEYPLRCHVINESENEQLGNQLKAFWEIEELRKHQYLSKAEQECEQHFVSTVQRATDGKLIVRIPFNMKVTDHDFLGQSLDIAKRRFFQLERRFAKDPELHANYTKGIHEYLQLKHAVPVEDSKPASYVIPHHAVLKESSLTTKLRTVFDASAKTTNGFSLNERMHIGPTIISDLWAVLLGWRAKKIAVTSDIEKMYRQFWIHPDDSHYQQMLWRDNPSQPLKRYELRTVTFGTAAAPFLAIRCLHHIADCTQGENPLLAQLIKKSFYVDDLLASFDSVAEAKEMKENLTRVFAEYGLNLRKWNANNACIISDETDELVSLQIHPSNTCNTLGMQWNTKTDMLSFKVNSKSKNRRPTKRSVLSEIASLFDPLGLLAPIVIRTKIFMQQLWLGAYDWDDELPDEIVNEWQQLERDIQQCNQITIDRWSGYATNNTHLSIHGFADASEKAYAAIVYLRTQHQDGTITVRLLVSKTKVAPLKTISIPRLELCAAALLSHLIKKLVNTLTLQSHDVHTWTDSSITLAWISTPPYKLKTFVAGKVAEIQENTRSDQWRYIQTKLNPADHASRGLSTNELIHCSQWWEGPKFLHESSEKWPKTPAGMLSIKTIPEMKAKVMHTSSEKHEENEILLKYSSYSRLLHVTAYCLRWLRRNKDERKQLVLKTHELIEARDVWLRIVQKDKYTQDIDRLRSKRPPHKRSSLLALSPFLDQNNVLRIQGRLLHSNKSSDAKQPAILPASSHLTTLIIRNAHSRAMHGSLQLTLRLIRDEFWIIRGRLVVKNQLNKCIACFRYRNSPLSQQMSNLKPAQVQPSRPFSHTGVDFAGHFEVKTSTRKNASFQKCYISLFICLTTKAVHLELAQDLSTEAFIAAFRRFIGRRGIPSHMYSDRGTNFIGAANELPSLWFDENSLASQAIQKECAGQGVVWHFNPARASHFGGLWEAGVKSVKRHIHRTFGETKFTYEIFNTILVQIEACINSRPLCSMNEDQSEPDALTPGHFLIGQPTMTLPHPNLTHVPLNRLSHYEICQRKTQEFWEKWSHEYLAQLQPRKKWANPQPNARVGQIVFIKEDTIKPSQWPMGRVTKVFKGKDELVRSVELEHIINSAESTCRKIVSTRPIHKLCLLPIKDNFED